MAVRREAVCGIWHVYATFMLFQCIDALTDALLSGLIYCRGLLIWKWGGVMAKPVKNVGVIRRSPKYAAFGSNDALARELIKQFPKVVWSLKMRSLSVKLGELDKGRTVWWINNPQNAECLTLLLDVSMADLGLFSQVGRHLFSFVEFPEMQPLDLKRDEAWILGDAYLDASQAKSQFGRERLDNWLDPAAWTRCPIQETDWLHVADALEREKLTLRLELAGRFKVIHVETLANALDRMADPAPLIIAVSGDGGAEDLAALVRRPARSGTLVIAPFTLPVRHQASTFEAVSWEHMTAGAQERGAMDLTAPGSFGSLRRWSWKLFPDWRPRLLNLVEQHLNRHAADTLLSAQTISEWLHKFDPRGVWFSSTSDMLHLCRMAHYMQSKFPAPDDRNASSTLARSLAAHESSSLIVQARRLAEARWQRRDLAWGTALTLETWLTLSPSGPAIVTSDGLAEIANGKTLQDRKKAASRLADVLIIGDPDALLASGLLKGDRYNYFVFQHSTLAGLIIRDSLIRQIAEAPLASWGLACFDGGRRPIVDAVLDIVPMAQLLDVSKRLALEDLNSAQAIGASEALFFALGRRIALGDQIPNELVSMAHGVLARLDFSEIEWALPKPWSRPVETQEEQLEWIGACWAWSLLPQARLPVYANCLFPGWCESFDDTPHWLADLWPEKYCETLSPAWDQFLLVVDQWMKDLEQPLAAAPRVLQIGLLGRAASGAWPADASWWQEWFTFDGREWMEDTFFKRISTAGAGVARNLLPSFFAWEQKFAGDSGYIARLSPIRRWLLKQLAPDAMLACLDDACLIYLASAPETLPPGCRIPLFRLLANMPTLNWSVNAGTILAKFGPGIAPVLADYLSHPSLGYAVSVYLWNWVPEEAAQILRSRTLGNDVRASLLWTSPASHVDAGIDALLATPDLLDASERLSWIRDRLASSASNAERLLSLRAAPTQP